MYVALPAAAYGGPEPASVLDLEPLLAYTRECRPDAVCMLPPQGPDDQPNGPALLAMKNRLEQEGLRVLGGAWEVPADAPVQDPGWQIEHLFEARALVAALGEAGVGPLLFRWRPGIGGSRGALREFLVRLLEEAERASVRIALCGGAAREEAAGLTAELESSCLGVCLCGAPGPGGLAAVPEGRVFAVTLAGELPGGSSAALLDFLRASGYSGPLVLEGMASPVEYAHAVGFLGGLMARES